MPHDIICPTTGVNGRVTLWRVHEETGEKTLLFTKQNQVQYTWGHIAARALGFKAQAGQPQYHIGAVYFEFENVADRDDAVVEALSFSKELNTAYYANLSGDRDFLRVPLIVAPATSTSIGYDALLPIGQHENQLTFFAQTAGSAGQRIGFGSSIDGKNSKIFAAALVATPDQNDPTKDIVFARTVFPAEQQVPKDASSQIGITWNIAFT
jgi:hypothetical protein